MLNLDEVALSKGELVTFLTNSSGRAKKKTIVGIIEGTKADDIVKVLNKIALVRRKGVEVVSCDMAPNMQAAIRRSFPNAKIVIDKFHVVKLVCDALQSERVKLRWKIIDLEAERLKMCKEENYDYKVRKYSNGDTEKQLLARSVHLLFKAPNKWTPSQEERAAILFKNYPRIKYLYEFSMSFRSIYQEPNYEKAETKLIDWIQKAKEMKNSPFYTAANSIETYFNNIMNYFKSKHTNAFAESFNSKIKRFRFNLRGVSDESFFYYRLVNLFA